MENNSNEINVKEEQRKIISKISTIKETGLFPKIRETLDKYRDILRLQVLKK